MNSAVNVNITNRVYIVSKLKEGHAIAREIKVGAVLRFFEKDSFRFSVVPTRIRGRSNQDFIVNYFDVGY
jgi:hypothetical protein